MLDRTFFAAVDALYDPINGTDALAPLFYSLIRFTRARTVLEAGMGYTSAFIAKALADNRATFLREQEGLITKTRRYVQEIEAMGAGGWAIDENVPIVRGLDSLYAPKRSRLANRRYEWLREPPTWAQPAYYMADYVPRLHCIDRMRSGTPAPRVMTKLRELGIAEHVALHEGDFWTFDLKQEATDDLPFDIMWIDLPVSVRQHKSLVSGKHSEMLNPNGGILIVHNMLNTEGGQVLTDELYKYEQKTRFGELEILTLMEPERVTQNSFLLLRRTGPKPDRVEPLFNATGEARYEEDARSLLRRS